MLSGSSALPCLLFLLLRHDTLIKIMWLKKLSPLCSFFHCCSSAIMIITRYTKKRKTPTQTFTILKSVCSFLHTLFFTPQNIPPYSGQPKNLSIYTRLGLGSQKLLLCGYYCGCCVCCWLEHWMRRMLMWWLCFTITERE